MRVWSRLPSNETELSDRHRERASSSPHRFRFGKPGVDCERAVGLARSICVVGTPQIDRRWIKESVLRLVWPGRARGRRIYIGECKLTAQRHCAGGSSLFYKFIAAVALRSASSPRKIADNRRSMSTLYNGMNTRAKLYFVQRITIRRYCAVDFERVLRGAALCPFENSRSLPASATVRAMRGSD